MESSSLDSAAVRRFSPGVVKILKLGVHFCLTDDFRGPPSSLSGRKPTLCPKSLPSPYFAASDEAPKSVHWLPSFNGAVMYNILEMVCSKIIFGYKNL